MVVSVKLLVRSLFYKAPKIKSLTLPDHRCSTTMPPVSINESKFVRLRVISISMMFVACVQRWPWLRINHGSDRSGFHFLIGWMYRKYGTYTQIK